MSKNIKMILVLVMQIAIGILVGVLADFWQVNAYVKYALIAVGVLLPYHFFKVKQGG